MRIDDLFDENRALKRQNVKLKRELRRYRKALCSSLNILDPEQRAIIRHDLIETDKSNTKIYA